MLATAAALLLTFAPGDAPVRFAPLAHQLVAAPARFAPPAYQLTDQKHRTSGAPGLVPFWAGLVASLAVDVSFAGAFLLNQGNGYGQIFVYFVGLVAELLKPVFIAAVESIVAKDKMLFWSALGASLLGDLGAIVLLGVATASSSMEISGIWLAASAAMCVVAMPALTYWPVAARIPEPPTLKLRWSF